jgi:hypothetical protein
LKNSWTFYQKLGKHLGVELQLGYRKDWNYFYVSSNLTRKCDHAGFGLEMEFLGAFFWLSIYDGRHWNYEEGKWEEYEKSNN